MRLDIIPHNKPDYRSLANAIRFLSMDSVEKAKSGHPGLPLGMADVATVLFQAFLKFDPKDPNWMDRDRFVLSAGHGSMLLYSLLYLCGYPKMTVDELKKFRQLGSLTPGHPEWGHTPGVETTTGPLGQGIATAVGMALAERMAKARFGDDVVDHHTYVIASDGDLMEGISHEAISLAGHLRLSKLIVLFDDNNISIDGATDLSVSDNQLQRFSASGWHVQAIDGHDYDAIYQAIEQARLSERPSMIACRTQIAHGAPNKAGSHHAHGAPLGAGEIEAAREHLRWTSPEFTIPEGILLEWHLPGQRGQKEHEQWQKRFDALPKEVRHRMTQNREDVGLSLKEAFLSIKETFVAEKPNQATRILSQRVLDAVAPHVPDLIGGSADLTGSNNTKAAVQKPISHDDFSGSYVYYGVREHAMAAVMNGIALHGGFMPYGGTFLVFSDYLRPSLRLSALMEQPVIYVLTHDSIGLGEDGPTHQPVEHLAALRAIPNLNVFRPCDPIEVAEMWEFALTSSKTPSVMALTRQNLPMFRENIKENLTAKGGYVLRETQKERDVTLIATGSEVSLAMEAADKLLAEGIHAAVVSVPCLDLFKQQVQAVTQSTLGQAPRVFIEAALPDSWYMFMRQDITGKAIDGFIGMHGFGASAPCKDLYKHFGITVDAIITKAKELMG